MRPLETHVEISSHLWMFNRVKELLTREGMLRGDASDAEIRTALNRWIEMMEEASKHAMPVH
ncbi:MAG: hypothetical protein F8N37_07700 [Telmatospirillum sp.]|nr:hypothetical protein [Telmatospirillum sp.]